MVFDDLLPLHQELLGGEAEMLRFSIERARVQFAWKAEGLSTEQLRQSIPTSSLTIAGLVAHLTFVEDAFFSLALGIDREGPAADPDWAAANRAQWHAAGDRTAEQLYADYFAMVERSQRLWPEVVADGGLDREVPDDDPAWTKNRRRVMADVLEEYLKHIGHIDLLREAVDGRVGNDPDDV